NGTELPHRRRSLPFKSRSQTQRSEKENKSDSSHRYPPCCTSIAAESAASIVSLVVSRRKGSENAKTYPVSGNSAHARPPRDLTVSATMLRPSPVPSACTAAAS